jgi:putative membrane protein
MKKMTYQNTPPPPPPQMADNRLASIKTYILIAWIFSLIVMVVWLISGVLSILSYITLASAIGIYAQYYSGFAATGALIEGIILLIFIVPAFLVFMRISKMRKAVNAGDIATLKATSNLMWAIIALIFGGVIPGIMLIISDGPIKQL